MATHDPTKDVLASELPVKTTPLDGSEFITDIMNRQRIPLDMLGGGNPAKLISGSSNVNLDTEMATVDPELPSVVTPVSDIDLTWAGNAIVTVGGDSASSTSPYALKKGELAFVKRDAADALTISVFQAGSQPTTSEGFITATSGQTLEVNKEYTIKGFPVNLPTATADGDFIRIVNEGHMDLGEHGLVASHPSTPMISSTHSSISTDQIRVEAGADFTFIWNAATSVWFLNVGLPLNGFLASVNSGVSLRTVSGYLIESTSVGDNYSAPPRAINKITLRSDTTSTQNITINQADLAGVAQFILEDGTKVKSFVIPEIQKNKEVVLYGHDINNEWHVYREWKQTSLDAVIDLTDGEFVDWNADFANSARITTSRKEITLNNPTNLRVGQFYKLEVANDNTGGIYEGVRVNLGINYSDISNTGETGFYVDGSATVNFIATSSTELQLISAVPNQLTQITRYNESVVTPTQHTNRYYYRTSDGTDLTVNNPTGLAPATSNGKRIHLQFNNGSAVDWNISFGTNYRDQNGSDLFSDFMLPAGESTTYSFVADTEGASNQIFREIHVKGKPSNLLNWQPNTFYSADSEVIATSSANGIKYLYSRPLAGTSRGTFDVTEEGLWDQLGAAADTFDILESLTFTFRGYASSYTRASITELLAGDGSAYDLTDWVVITDTNNTIPIGSQVSGIQMAPPTNGVRSVAIRYRGTRQLRGLSNTTIQLRGDAASTGLVSVNAKYYSGQSELHSTGQGALAGSVSYAISPPNGFDFLTLVDANTAQASSAATIQETVTQTSHGLVVLTPVLNTGMWVAATDVDSALAAQWVITEIVDANTFVVTKFGQVTVTGHGLTDDNYYWLGTGAGALTRSTTGTVQTLWYVIDANTLLIEVGTASSSSTGGGGTTDLTNYYTKPEVDQAIADVVITGTTTSQITNSTAVGTSGSVVEFWT